jgi:hypothetical protein
MSGTMSNSAAVSRWRSFAGNLVMPPDFFSLLSLPATVCQDCGGDHASEIVCCCSRPGLNISMPSSVEVSLSMCLFCGCVHVAAQACPCFRCGYQHTGDCTSICRLCRRSHPTGSRCRTNAQNFTARRRTEAIFCDDDGIFDRVPPELHTLGLMFFECPHCRARNWRGEKLSCCHHGAIHVPLFDIVPAELSLIILSSHVRQNIRPYNTIMAFASTGHQNKSIVGGTFVLGGRAYHRIGSLLPVPGVSPAFSQIWTLDTEDATVRRQELMPSLRAHILTSLHNLFIIHNRLSRMFKSAAASVSRIGDAQSAALGFSWSATDDLKGFEMASIIESPGFQRQIVVRTRSDRMQSINDCHQLYHALTYPLLFPTGGSGWHNELEHRGRKISLTEFMRFHMMHRGDVTHVQRCERLALEYYCDSWAQVESRNMAFHKQACQQAKYQGASARVIMDQLTSDNTRQIGVPVVLPSSYPNSPRFYHNL